MKNHSRTSGQGAGSPPSAPNGIPQKDVQNQIGYFAAGERAEFSLIRVRTKISGHQAESPFGGSNRSTNRELSCWRGGRSGVLGARGGRRKYDKNNAEGASGRLPTSRPDHDDRARDVEQSDACSPDYDPTCNQHGGQDAN